MIHTPPVIALLLAIASERRFCSNLGSSAVSAPRIQPPDSGHGGVMDRVDGLVIRRICSLLGWKPACACDHAGVLTSFAARLLGLLSRPDGRL